VNTARRIAMRKTDFIAARSEKMDETSEITGIAPTLYPEHFGIASK
jgi:hypothetical protein